MTDPRSGEPARAAAPPSGPLGDLDPLAARPSGGAFLAHYELIEEVGRGGMGTVYRARDTLLDRDVAVKVLSDEWQEDVALQERFVREAKIVARLSHPSLPHIHFVGRARGRLFFAMEWIDGETLECVARKGRLPVAKALDVARQIASGLAAAHRAGVIHRDIKPANVMITREGVAKILDFGIARSVSFGTETTLAGAFVGTAQYASPEQASGQKLDARSDLYSLGVVLHELVSGRPPFTGESALAVLTARLTQPPPELPDDVDVDPGVRRLVRALMARDPAERPQSADDVVRLIDEVIPVPPVPARLSRRWLAALTDLLLLAIPPSLIGLVYLRITHHFITTPLYDSIAGRVALAVLGLGWPLVYFVLLVDRRGRTIGQRLEGIRIAGREGNDPSRGQLLVRTAAIWAPLAVLMALQPDWPPGLDPDRATLEPILKAAGERALVLPVLRLALSSNAPLLLAVLWVLVAAMPWLHRRRGNAADRLSGTEIVEPEPRRSAAPAEEGLGARARRRPGAAVRRALVATVVLGAWCGVGVLAVLQATPTWPGVSTPALNERLVAGDPGWTRLLARFERWALNADERFLNPEQLVFVRRFFSLVFWANTRGWVKIENRAYGAGILHQTRIWWVGGYAGGNTTAVNELIPRDSLESRRWDAKRRAAYRGSHVHFLRALMHRRLAREGFEIRNPRAFVALVRQGERFLLVAWPRLEVRVAGSPVPHAIELPEGSLEVTPEGTASGAFGVVGWTWLDEVPPTVLERYAAEQDSMWGERTADIREVTELR